MGLVGETRGNSYRWVIGAVLMLINLAMGINFFAPAPLFPMIMAEYGLDRSRVSLLVASVTAIMALFTLLGGFIAARIGIRRAFACGVLLMGAGALAPVAPNFFVLLLLRVCYGVGASIAIPVTSALVMQWFKPRELSLVNGLNITAQNCGVTMSLFIGVPLAEAWGWRFPLALYGSLALGGGVLWLLFGRSPGRATGVAPILPLRESLSLLKERSTLLLQLAVIGPFALGVALNTWLPAYYHEVFGMSLTRASFLTGLFPLVGIVATLAGGILPARIGLRRPILIWPSLVLVVAAFGTFLFNNSWILYTSVALSGFFGGIFIPTLFTIPMELPRMSPEKVAVVMAAIITVGNFAGFLSPLLVGVLTDVLGSYIPGLSLLAMLPVTLVIAGILLPETGPKASRASLRVGPQRSEGAENG